MSSPPTSDGNHRVTLAVLGSKVDTLAEEVKALRTTMNRRMDFLEEKLEADRSDLLGRCQDNATQVARLEERQKATTSILTGLNIVIGSIAATIGAIFK